jgi:hypothetical protein
MLDSKEQPVSVVPTKINGDVTLYLSMTPNSYEAFHTQQTFDIITLPASDIKVDENYYLIIQGKTPKTELSITLQQKNQYSQVYDGVPQTVYFADYEDASKSMIFSMPDGEYTILFSLKSKTNGFYPTLALSIAQKDGEGEYLNNQNY